MAAGYAVDQVLREMQKPEEPPAPIDTTDFAAALQNEDSKRRFYVVESDQELADMLAAPSEQWRIFLHPRQRQLVRMRASGPVRVLGGAGTGKTVTAMHRAQEYRAQLNENGKKEFVDLIRDARHVIESKRLKLPYRAVIVTRSRTRAQKLFDCCERSWNRAKTTYSWSVMHISGFAGTKCRWGNVASISAGVGRS